MPDNHNRFIATELTGEPGEAGESIVWSAICHAFETKAEQGSCLAYWRYPLFPTRFSRTIRRPDFLIADKGLGLIVIEVKDFKIDDIVSIDGDWWRMQEGFYDEQINPYQQAERQLTQVLAHAEKTPELCHKVTGRAIVALPNITSSQWQKRFNHIAACVPIIFQDQLGRDTFLKQIQQSHLAVPGELLNSHRWKLLQLVIRGEEIPPSPPPPLPVPTRASVLVRMRAMLHELDLAQEHIGKTIPPGPQRIRGIVGSGKTIMLCQKTAHMHLSHPDWDIALVFFTRSLYDVIIEQVNRWLDCFSGGEIQYNPNSSNSKLKILHAWGEKKQPGLYSTISKNHNVSSSIAESITKYSPSERLAYLSKRILKDYSVKPMFDAILIDEGQDLIVDNDELKYEDKQSIYWLVWQVLRQFDPNNPKSRRLIWAYDAAQSLDTLRIPTVKELFGKELSQLVSGQYSGGISKSEVMYRCYRTPSPILTAAHGIGMGLLRPAGMLSGLTTKKDWENIGYQVQGDFRQREKSITVRRPPENSPNPLPSLWEKPLVEFDVYDSRSDELSALAEKIKHNLKTDRLKPSREILVIVLAPRSIAKSLEAHVAKTLIDRDINIFIPSALRYNELRPTHPNVNPNNFWYEGAVTVSRIHRAKGNEADMVYVVGFDNIACDESNISLRNQVFVALTRSRAWVCLSGIKNPETKQDYPLYDEMRQVISSGNTFTFKFQPPQRDVSDREADDE
jgi:superfamily I DNA and RNA helicase